MNEIDRIERRISLHDVRILMSVVQAGSMGKAAKHLATSQPAISRSIAELEHALGVRLLDRTPQGIEPTLYGRALIKRGLAVFDELTQGVKDIQILADPTAGELRVGGSIAVAAASSRALSTACPGDIRVCPFKYWPPTRQPPIARWPSARWICWSCTSSTRLAKSR